MPKVTLHEVARQAGLSKPYVSKILNNKEPMASQATIKKVMDIARKLEYHPDYLASSLRSGKRNCIGVAGAAHLYNINDPVISAIYAGIGETVEAEQNLLTIIPQSTGGRETYEDVLNKVIKSRMLDGIIMFIFPAHEKGFTNNIGRIMQEEKVPFVPVFFTDYQPEGFYSVGFDPIAAGRLAAQHLVDQGEKDIFTISYENTIGPGFYQACQQVVKDAGLKVQGYHYQGKSIDFYNEDLLKGILNEHGVHRSYIACWDPLAYQLVQRLEERGTSIPEDVRLVSCGNAIPERDHYSTITTVDRKFAEIGKKAAEFLFEQINEPGAEPKHYVAKPELIVRQSSLRNF